MTKEMPQEVLEIYDELRAKANPYHDELGRFTFAPGGGATGGEKKLEEIPAKSIGSDKKINFSEVDDQAKKWGGKRSELAHAALLNMYGGSDGLILREGEDVVAVAAFDPNDDKRYVLLGQLATKQKGYGRQVMRSIARKAAKLGKGIFLYADPEAVGFYKKLGMTAWKEPEALPLVPFSFGPKATKTFAFVTKAEDDDEPESGVFCDVPKNKKAKIKVFNFTFYGLRAYAR